MRDCVGGEQSAQDYYASSWCSQAVGALSSGSDCSFTSARHASWHLMLMANVNGALTRAVFLLVRSLFFITLHDICYTYIQDVSFQLSHRNILEKTVFLRKWQESKLLGNRKDYLMNLLDFVSGILFGLGARFGPKSIFLQKSLFSSGFRIRTIFSSKADEIVSAGPKLGPIKHKSNLLTENSDF